MKMLLRYLFLATFIFSVSCGSKPRTTEEKAKTIILPPHVFYEATIFELADYLTIYSRAFDPKHEGIVVIPDKYFADQNPNEKPRRFSLSLDTNSHSVLDILRYTTALTSTKFRMDEDKIIIFPLTETKNIEQALPANPSQH